MASISASGLLAVFFLSAAGCATTGAREPATAFIPFGGTSVASVAAAIPRTPIDRAGRYRLAFSAHREGGCSRGYWIENIRGEYVLELGADGRAELAMTSRETSTSGSRMLGASESSSWANESSATWKGEAHAALNGVAITLREARVGCGGGNGRSGASDCSVPKTVALTCAFERAEIAPPRSDDSEAILAPIALEVMRCTGAPAPFHDDDPTFATHLPLSNVAPLALSAASHRFGGEEAPTLYLETPPP